MALRLKPQGPILVQPATNMRAKMLDLILHLSVVGMVV